MDTILSDLSELRTTLAKQLPLYPIELGDQKSFLYLHHFIEASRNTPHNTPPENLILGEVYVICYTKAHCEKYPVFGHFKHRVCYYKVFDSVNDCHWFQPISDPTSICGFSPDVNICFHLTPLHVMLLPLIKYHVRY